jgi:hypothetical protein
MSRHCEKFGPAPAETHFLQYFLEAFVASLHRDFTRTHHHQHEDNLGLQRLTYSRSYGLGRGKWLSESKE